MLQKVYRRALSEGGFATQQRAADAAADAAWLSLFWSRPYCIIFVASRHKLLYKSGMCQRSFGTFNTVNYVLETKNTYNTIVLKSTLGMLIFDPKWTRTVQYRSDHFGS
jgi:hypothetical protein